MRKMTKGMLMTALILGAVAAQGNAYAAGPEFVLDEMVVTASRMETRLIETPANVTVIDAEKLEARHYQNVAEALKDVPGAHVLDNGLGACEQKIMLNGDDRVLVLVDGRRVGFDMGVSSGRGSYDLNLLPDIGLIERVEVVKGASGALYGSDAVGGVVNIITKKLNRNYGNLSAGFGSHGAQDLKASYTGKENKTGFTFSASKYEQDYYKYKDAKTGANKRWPGESNYENKKLSLKVEQEIDSESFVTLGYDRSDYDGFSSGNINWSTNRLDKKAENVFGRYDWSLGDADEGYLQLYHNELEYDYLTPKKEKTNGIDLQQAYALNEAHKLVAGFNWRESEASNKTIYDEHKIKNTSVYLTDSWKITEDLSLNGGIRYDDHNKAGDETTWSFGLNKQFNENSHIYANWGEVFKAPTLDDLYWDEPWMQGNTDLKAETGESWTVGYASQINDRTNVGISYFKADLDDAITWDLDVYPNVVKNIYKQKREGIELNISHALNDNVSLEGSYSYVKVRNNEKNSGYVRDWNQIPNTYRLGVRYQDGKFNSSLFLRAGTGASTGLHPAAYGPKASFVDDSYITMDLAVDYKYSDELSLYLKAYNIFNEAYAENAGVEDGTYKTPAMSRRFILGAEYTF